MTSLEVGDIVLCTVERIEKAVVFVKIEGNGRGSIILSEIAPGRIRNLRDYVVPKKVIICKVLRVSGNRIDLSLRRVTPKEQKELKEANKYEKSSKSVLKSVLKEKAVGVIEEILKEDKVYDFLEEAKVDSKKLEKLVGKTDSKKILDIISSQKEKVVGFKKIFSFASDDSNGLGVIKKILGDFKDVEIKYLSSGKYSIKAEGSDIKSVDNKVMEILEKIGKEAKKNGAEFSILEK
jgi:translation initiation factor 2 alpha subunit (eIF-2alpha)